MGKAVPGGWPLQERRPGRKHRRAITIDRGPAQQTQSERSRSGDFRSRRLCKPAIHRGVLLPLADYSASKRVAVPSELVIIAEPERTPHLRPVENSALGTDYSAAVDRAEKVLLPAFDAWRKGGEVMSDSPASLERSINATTKSASSWSAATS